MACVLVCTAAAISARVSPVSIRRRIAFIGAKRNTMLRRVQQVVTDANPTDCYDAVRRTNKKANASGLVRKNGTYLERQGCLERRDWSAVRYVWSGRANEACGEAQDHGHGSQGFC